MKSIFLQKDAFVLFYILRSALFNGIILSLQEIFNH